MRPFEWTLARVEEFWPHFERAGIFSDDIPKSADGFISYIIANRTLWFEVLKAEGNEHIGFVYFSDFLGSWTEKRYLSCSFHSIVWDHRARGRETVVLKLIGLIFLWFGIHRMFAAIPLKFGGAIRIAKQLGFKEEGILHEARRYNGEWFGVLILSMTEGELNQDKTASIPSRKCPMCNGKGATHGRV